MRIRAFEYHRARTLEEALELLDKYGEDAKVLAGGTDLVLRMKAKHESPEHVVDIQGLKELEFVRVDSGHMRIGSLVRHRDLSIHPDVKKLFPSIAEAVGLIGSWQIRSVGTIGGNICNASPAADAAPPLLALGGKLVVVDTEGEKEIPVASFFKGPGKSVLTTRQIVKEITVPLPEGRASSAYRKLRRRKAVDVSLAGVAFSAELDSAGEKIADARIALGAVAPTPVEVPEIGNLLGGLSCGEAIERLGVCVEATLKAISPIDDVRATGEYRRDIVAAFVEKAAKEVLGNLSSKGQGSSK
jgi:carbon-monoxide dehydrogenase medium subunit